MKLAIVDHNSKCRHHRQRHHDIRARNQSTLNLDRGDIRGVRKCHEKPAQELARNIALHKGIAPVETVRLNGDWRTAVAEIRADRTEPVKSIEEVGDRPLPHSHAAIERVCSPRRRQHGRQEPEARARIGQFERCRSRRQLAAAALNPDRGGVSIMINLDSQGLQCTDHHRGILAIKRSAQNARSIRPARDRQRRDWSGSSTLVRVRPHDHAHVRTVQPGAPRDVRSYFCFTHSY